jgi:hypothetical protein
MALVLVWHGACLPPTLPRAMGLGGCGGVHPTSFPPKKFLGFFNWWFIIGFMFQIESGVEIPPQSQPLRKTKYPFNRLNVGDSFVFPVSTDEDREAVQNRLQSAAANWGRSRGMRFVTRRVTQGIRVWRVK